MPLLRYSNAACCSASAAGSHNPVKRTPSKVAKLILSLNGVVLQELLLQKDRITIGRRPENDIVLNNPAVSSVHAAVVTINGDSFLEDLDSTNGTQVNGQPVKKHFLRKRDVIEVAQYTIHYIPDMSTAEQTQGSLHPRPVYSPRDTSRKAVIRILNGPNVGKEVQLNKPFTTIGQAGGQVAVIARSTRGYTLGHIDGESRPALNGDTLSTVVYPLNQGDLIDLDGITLAFFFVD